MLIRRHQTIPNTANQTLLFEGVALTVDGDITAGFAFHFEFLASSLENEEFDVDHLLDVLLLEECCKQISRLTEPMRVIPWEVSGIIKFLKIWKGTGCPWTCDRTPEVCSRPYLPTTSGSHELHYFQWIHTCCHA